MATRILRARSHTESHIAKPTQDTVRDIVRSQTTSADTAVELPRHQLVCGPGGGCIGPVRILPSDANTKRTYTTTDRWATVGPILIFIT